MSAGVQGVLHLVPVALGGDNVAAALPQTTLTTVAGLDYFVAENPKSARHFLKHVPHPQPLQQLRIELFDKDGTAARARDLLQPLVSGRSAGVLSEAGCPAIADPGSLLVEAAHRMGLRVVPHVGPSSLILALMASGFSGQRFAFHGYLPVARGACKAQIAKLEREARAADSTQIFIETPYRNDALLQQLLETCAATTLLCIASDLTLPTESVRRASIAEWKNSCAPLGRRPSVFLIYAR